jgi:hypothetical protein
MPSAQTAEKVKHPLQPLKVIKKPSVEGFPCICNKPVGETAYSRQDLAVKT